MAFAASACVGGSSLRWHGVRLAFAWRSLGVRRLRLPIGVVGMAFAWRSPPPMNLGAAWSMRA
eukprot:1189426-Heterocapsa_arctica.AAC.1